MKWIQKALTYLLPSLVAAHLSLHGDERPRPNILFIFTDDQRADTLGTVNPEIVTPHLDELARTGIVFDRAYVTTAICSPSRASTLTGRYGTRNGVCTLSAALNPGERTFAQYLAEAGYRTAQFGKWHLKTTPSEAGFQSYARMNSNGSWYQRNIDSNIPDAPAALNGRFYEEVMADLLIDYIGESARSDQPFVAWWCTQVPHLDDKMKYPDVGQTQELYDPADLPVPGNWADEPAAWTAEAGQRPPYLAQSRFVSKSAQENYGGPGGYDNPAPGVRNRTLGEDNVQNHLREYYAAITALDQQIGRVMARLEDPDGDGDTSDSIADNTWIIFMGDNGWFTGHHRFTSKVLPYEEASRIPMLVRGPDIAPRTEHQLVLNIDLTRLILDIAGVHADTDTCRGAISGHSSTTPPPHGVTAFIWRGSFPSPAWAQSPLTLSSKTTTNSFAPTRMLPAIRWSGSNFTISRTTRRRCVTSPPTRPTPRSEMSWPTHWLPTKRPLPTPPTPDKDIRSLLLNLLIIRPSMPIIALAHNLFTTSPHRRY
ncbi:MAG: sulfatase-like hydrolase/transferase [Verrucomicrobiota bacterium JB024]|nr:sulfatase-like hydrolase/transferase [Verrucomicrobiota bacterium JB024]